ncbi:MAG: hypothetical protein RMK80_05535, partial [Pseudobdellovibrionaceae bacterium]|nr:hypothetical protein [Pseudobdellovibrionaceae bacterium]
LNLIYNSCGIIGQARVLGQPEISEIYEENGYRSYLYKTDLVMKVKVDQNIYDVYVVTVQSKRNVDGAYQGVYAKCTEWRD